MVGHGGTPNVFSCFFTRKGDIEDSHAKRERLSLRGASDINCEGTKPFPYPSSHGHLIQDSLPSYPRYKLVPTVNRSLSHIQLPELDVQADRLLKHRGGEQALKPGGGGEGGMGQIVSGPQGSQHHPHPTHPPTPTHHRPPRSVYSVDGDSVGQFDFLCPIASTSSR